MLDKATLNRLWLLLSDLQDTLPEFEDRTEEDHEVWGDIDAVMAYVDCLSRNLREEEGNR